MNTGVRSGVLLAVIGVWIIMRATHKDSTKTADFPDGRTLIDHIIGKQTGAGGLPQTPTVKAAEAASQTHSFGPLAAPVNALQAVTNLPLQAANAILPGALGDFFGGLEAHGGVLSSADQQRLTSLPQPPPQLVKAIRGTPSEKHNAAAALASWMQHSGYTRQDVTNYANYKNLH